MKTPDTIPVIFTIQDLSYVVMQLKNVKNTKFFIFIYIVLYFFFLLNIYY